MKIIGVKKVAYANKKAGIISYYFLSNLLHRFNQKIVVINKDGEKVDEKVKRSFKR